MKAEATISPGRPRSDVGYRRYRRSGTLYEKQYRQIWIEVK